ncbi:MAG: DUF4143 domain-containing protein [Gammaproteobacteria bacterium]|nr:DUF4143 domain-containing protein [Gammaproteobacteria bacterium]
MIGPRQVAETTLAVRIAEQARSRYLNLSSVKVYVRGSGLMHALLGLPTDLQLYGHPVVGQSWERFVIENILSVIPPGTQTNFYRTAKRAEIDLILRFTGFQTRWAIEIKRNIAARRKKGFYIALLSCSCFSKHRNDLLILGLYRQLKQGSFILFSCLIRICSSF